ncbi:hypothetical protein Patl1_33912 [Pistacia atlantica]|uniref:Uncharacterized protein n=1 Tax=Pistacia atlantica TaxID=434234 RepID=A0ACC0ZV75_9ROSI|nr:hypothetical protein Patl1_33912 [Pistacia atlantica]
MSRPPQNQPPAPPLPPKTPHPHQFLISTQISSVVTNFLFSYGQPSRIIREVSNISWQKGPIQPGTFERGYYLMGYMKDIVENGLTSLKNNFMGKERYTRAEMDEIRGE